MKADLISIDPGVRASGCAIWHGDRLLSVAYGAPAFPMSGALLLIEKPQVYQGRAQKGDPNDLIELAVEVGRIIGVSNLPFEAVRPRTWKGTVKKEVMLRRILSKLTDMELKLLKNLGLPKSAEHNVIDAVGLGLWYLKRL